MELAPGALLQICLWLWMVSRFLRYIALLESLHRQGGELNGLASTKDDPVPHLCGSTALKKTGTIGTIYLPHILL